MARIICTQCGEVRRNNRSKHLRDAHGFDTSRGGLVAKYFITPESLGLSKAVIESFRDGKNIDDIVVDYVFPLTIDERRQLIGG